MSDCTPCKGHMYTRLMVARWLRQELAMCEEDGWDLIRSPATIRAAIGALEHGRDPAEAAREATQDSGELGKMLQDWLTGGAGGG